MIKPSEIQNKAREVSVRDQQIEKDYILSWILQAVAKNDNLSKSLVFKGGTVLKKVYFNDYRFSEDLDFTLLKNEIANDEIFIWFKKSFEYIKEEANIDLEIIDNNEHEDGGINFYISYVGPLGGHGNNKRVKVDISRNEKLEFAPIIQNLLISYSDQDKHQLLCYSLEEVLVEKLRSVMQRMQARDLYDIWYLLEIHGIRLAHYLQEFKAKCESKEINSLQFQEKFEQRIASYKGRWQTSLKDQIKNLPEFEQVIREVQRHFKKLVL